MSHDFPLLYEEVLQRIHAIDPVRYQSTRNYINGTVTRLSPYLSRGFISTVTIAEIVRKKYTGKQSYKLLRELAWREYFQRVWQKMGEDILKDIRHPQFPVAGEGVPAAVTRAATGINAIDHAIENLFQHGYMHNHTRMYTAMLTCNIAKAHWLHASQWMYYHLLDGDIASNSLSWQWVAGCFSSKKYYANQENIDHYCNTKQKGSFLDHSYEILAEQPVPQHLTERTSWKGHTLFPKIPEPIFDHTLPLCLYNSYQLDPQWHAGEKMNRVLLLEPSHFEKFPVSEQVLGFIIRLAKENIPGIQVFYGECNDIPGLTRFSSIYYKEHPISMHYPGTREEREWLFPGVTGFYPSFSAYWKKCEKYLR